MATADELEAHLAEQPDDTEAYLVLADLLTLQGDPRGELIMLQHRLLVGSKDKTLRVRAQKVLERFQAQLAKDTGGVTGRWHLGYLAAGRIEVDSMTPAVIDALFAHPSARLMTELELSALAHRRGELHAALGALARSKRFTLRSLIVRAQVLYPSQDFRAPVPQRPEAYRYVPPWPSLPLLEKLHLDGDLLLPPIAHPRLTSLVLDHVPLAEGDWDVPALHALDWGQLAGRRAIMRWEPGAAATVARLDRQDRIIARVLSTPPSALRDLTLRGDLGRRMLTDLPLMQLDRVCLPYPAVGTIQTDDIPRLRHLKRLLVTNVPRGLTPRAIQRTLPRAIWTAKDGGDRAVVHLDAKRLGL